MLQTDIESILKMVYTVKGLHLALRKPYSPDKFFAYGAGHLCTVEVHGRKLTAFMDKVSKGGKQNGGNMAKQKEIKTNAMRILESMKIPFVHYTYECDEFVDGLQIADQLSLPYEKVYKTLVTVGNSRNYFVFVLPVAEELDLKAAARSVGEKSVEMIPVKDINRITGYIRGGCTAIGMKKQYVTRIDSSARRQGKIIVSGGRIGSQLELLAEDLAKAAGAEFADIVRQH